MRVSIYPLSGLRVLAMRACPRDGGDRGEIPDRGPAPRDGRPVDRVHAAFPASDGRRGFERATSCDDRVQFGRA